MSLDRDPWRPTFVLFTCEHGGKDVPAAYTKRFRDAEAVLDGHRGHDVGALGVALRMASRLSAPIIFSTVTRLLIDLNRSIDRADAFSEFTRDLPEDERDRIASAFHAPHRDSVRRTVGAAVTAGHRVLHVGVHSFTEVLGATRRDFDIALLFDAARPGEADLCERWRSAIQRRNGELRVRFNEPYRGADDGLTTALRARFAPNDYVGLELELRQGAILHAPEQDSRGELLADTLETVVRSPAPG